MSEPMINSKNLKINNEVSKDIALVHADENRVQQILFNLIGNAIKFTNEGSITISAKARNDFVRTTISDTGIGISEDKMDTVFKVVSGAVFYKFNGGVCFAG